MNEKGILELRDTYELVRKIQLQNIVSPAKRGIILCSQELFRNGMGEDMKPTDVLVGVIETKDNKNIFALIVNDFVLTTIDNDRFVVDIDDDTNDLVIVGNELLNRNDFPYEEYDITNKDQMGVWRNR